MEGVKKAAKSCHSRGLLYEDRLEAESKLERARAPDLQNVQSQADELNSLNLMNRRMPNGTYGGVGGQGAS